MKLLGAGLLLCTGLLAGCAAARRLDQQVQLLRLLRQMLTAMMQTLQATLPLTADLLQMLADTPAFAELRFLQVAAGNPENYPQCWLDAVRHDPALVMETVGQTLGSTALDGQLAALQLCLDRLGALQTDAENAAAKHCGLCRSMGILSALFLAILLL